MEDFENYLEDHGFEKYADELRDYEDLIRQRVNTKNVDPRTALAGALYDAKRGEMTQYDVAVFSEVTEVSIRNAREAMGLRTERNLDALKNVIPFEKAPLLEKYVEDTLAEPPEALAAVVHSEVLDKSIKETVEYFGVTEEDAEKAAKWIEDSKDSDQLALESVRRHLDEVRKEPTAFKELLE